MTLKKIFLVIAVLTTGLTPSWAGSPLTISIDAAHPEVAISPDFSGLSFESSQMLSAKNGLRYFSPDNRPLIDLFQTLGIKSLRVGGNTADRSAGQLPDKADIDSLFTFARIAGVKVIYCLRLHDGDPEQDAALAKYIMDNYAAQLDSFSIGQEPNVYPKVTNSMGVVSRPAYADYKKQWKQFENAIVAQAPEAKFCGPSVDNNPVWPQNFMADFGRGNHVVLITAHLYPGRSGDKVPTPEIGRDQMLEDGFIRTYQKLYVGFVPTAISNNLPYRLEEANNYFNGGAVDVSDTFASALWGLDFMYWWAAHGADGVNFHTGDKVAAGNELRASRYTAYFSVTNGFLVRPLGYGIKAFDVGRHGRIVPATISNPQNLNVSVYSVLGDDKYIYVTIINKEHGSAARDADVSLDAGARFDHGQIMSLTVPGNDIASKTGVTLGGAVIETNGSWNGKWTELTPAGTGSFTVKVPAASASILRLVAD
ncbi:MAG TPA: hypothetical protein VGI03_05505 [Verrucomicrobiae bacterium]